MLSHLSRALRAAAMALGGHVAGGRSRRSEQLILFYNSMWGQPLEPCPEPLPDGFRITTEVHRFAESVAVVFHLPSLDRPPRQPKPPGQLWVAWSKECDVNYPQLRDPEYMRAFDLTMTYRLDADVAIPYTSYYAPVSGFARVLRQAPRPKPADRLAALFMSSPFNRSCRLEYASELMRHLDVHSYGKVLQNRQLVPDQGRSTKLALIAGYKFTLALENAIGEDYVTEKFFDPLVAGSVPVYLGAPNVDAFAPGERCFINTADFGSPKVLAQYLLDLQHDDAAYQTYFAWKQQPFRPSFLSLLAGQETPRDVRLCRAILARRRREHVGAAPGARPTAETALPPTDGDSETGTSLVGGEPDEYDREGETAYPM